MRIRPGLNIDDRESRIVILDKFMKIAKIDDDIDIETQNVDFFEEDNFKNYLVKIINQVDKEVKTNCIIEYLDFNQDNVDLKASEARGRVISELRQSPPDNIEESLIESIQQAQDNGQTSEVNYLFVLYLQYLTTTDLHDEQRNTLNKKIDILKNMDHNDSSLYMALDTVAAYDLNGFKSIFNQLIDAIEIDNPSNPYGEYKLQAQRIIIPTTSTQESSAEFMTRLKMAINTSLEKKDYDQAKLSYIIYLERLALTYTDPAQIKIIKKKIEKLKSFGISQKELHLFNDVQVVLDNALKESVAEESPVFDPQGRILFEDEKTIVSLDISQNAKLQEKYNDELKKYLPSDNCETILDVLNNLPSKKSIIFLHQELHFHLSLAFRVYQKLFPEIDINSDDFQRIHKNVMREVNVLVMKAFADALTEAVDVDTKIIDLDKLNRILDNKRSEITPIGHDILLKHLRAETNLALKTDKKSKDYKEKKSQAKHFAETITATGKDILHTDNTLGLAKKIDGSEVTSHDRRVGNYFAHRGITTYRLEGDEIHYHPKCLQIRTPSLPVKTGLGIFDEPYIKDATVKISTLVAEHDIENPFTYNLLTAMQDIFDDLNPFKRNYQTQSARHIILGAHEHNRKIIDNGSKSLCLVQAISVNGHGNPLGYHRIGPSTSIQNEATLLSEMTLCYNIRKEDVFIDNYKSFLQSSKPKGIISKFLSLFRSVYFVNSSEGRTLKKNIQGLKEHWQKPLKKIDKENVSELVKTSLRKVMAFDLHFRHDYAKLVQALSLFIEDESLMGCKSGNERTPIIFEREEILENTSGIPAELREAFISLSSATNEGEAIKAADNLKACIDKCYDKGNLYGATAVISLVDQGAGHKINAKKTLKHSLDSNYAEESSIDNLHQEYAKPMQSHNDGLTNYMFKAMAKSPALQQQLEDSSDPSSYTDITKATELASGNPAVRSDIEEQSSTVTEKGGYQPVKTTDFHDATISNDDSTGNDHRDTKGGPSL
ncbi:MAG: hypothetical protein P1U74_05715 [Legionellaceae bacterium]|nr:hypothetical protein [Legionellaceae bacterium]